MRGKKGFRQTRSRDIRVVFAGINGDTIQINTATPTSLNGTDPNIIFSGFQSVALPQNTPTTATPTLRLASDGNKFALLSYMPADLGATPTASQILVSPDAKIWRTRTLPTRNTTDAIKHAWAEVYGFNGQFIVAHSYYPDVVVSDNNNRWTLLQNVFAVNGFQPNNIVLGAGKLIAAADDAKVIYQSVDNGTTWTQISTAITINEFSANPQNKTLDQILALAYGPDGATNVFFMLARRSDVARYRYVLTSPDGITWTQRLRVDLGTTGTPQEPLLAASPARVIVLWNNLTTATTLTTTTSASTWTQLPSTPAANWRTLTYDGTKFVATGEPFGVTAAPIVMTMVPTAPLTWSVKLTGTQKLRGLVVGSSVQIQPDSTPLGAPTNLYFASAAAEQININWQRPYVPNGATIIDYVIQSSTDNGTIWVDAATAVKAGAGAIVINLTTGVEYVFRVAAVTDDGVGPYSVTSAAAVPGIDPYGNRVSLLLKFNTADNAFIDSSPESKPLFITGLVTLSNEQSRWGDGSAQFAGGTILLNSSAAFGFSTGDFTIEFWAFPIEQTFAGGIINVGYYYDGLLFRQRQSGWWYTPDSLYFNGAAANWDSEQNMPSNVWTHIALVRESGMVSVYANGVRVLNYEQPADLGTSQFVTIGAGAHSGLDEPFIGYLDDLRITKGAARYSGPSVQVPTGPF